MAEQYVCSEHPEHVHDTFTDYLTESWYEALDGTRVKAGNYDVPTSGECGAPPEDHPSRAQRMAGKVEGFAMPSHSYQGDGGPCTHEVAMAKLVGFRCIDCGGLIEDMPTKD